MVEKIAVTGSNGMLGKAVVDYARQRGCKVYALTRMELEFLRLDSREKAYKVLPDVDVVINCAGLTPEHPDFANPTHAVQVNALAPHVLAEYCKRLIHVSTDCVFSGRDQDRVIPRGYTEDDIPSPSDFYGQTKLAGEVTYGNHLTIRTSFIGRERGLLGWFLSQPHGAGIAGWGAAVWNGLTNVDLADYLLMLADRPDITGLLNIGTVPITKYELLWLAGEAFGREDIQIQRVDTPAIYRYLNTSRMRYEGLPNPSFHKAALERLACQPILV